ncbi:MAG: hypothetical protein KBT13_05785 [Bacteroidales bacterium]|nr:hypothetical protein [Candidatus Sodaliphilus limicaballi]
MINDNELDNMLRDYNPETGDGRDIITDLERRMDAVDMVKKYQARQMGQLRLRAKIAFAAGMVMGCVLMIIANLLPSPTEIITVTTTSPLLNGLIENIHYILGSMCIMLMLYGGHGMMSAREHMNPKNS